MDITTSPHKTILIISLSLVVALLAITPGLAQTPPTQPPPPAATPVIIPGEIVVKFQANVDRLGAQNSLRAEGLRPLEVSSENEAVRVAVKPGQEAQAIAELLARGDVVYATYNYEIKALVDPNDPYYSSQWALKNAADHDIDAPEGWNIHTGTNNTIIAVVDTGVDLDHPDLAAKITTGAQVGYNYISPGSQPNDDNGHGTHVAGIAAAIGNNGKGIAGVSWGARIMPLKILDAAGNGGTHNLSLAIKYAADHGARVINMSLGGSCGTGWPEVEDAVNYALSKGVVLVAASGNSGIGSVFCPAAIAGVIAVGATDSNDNRAYYSNYGTDLDVVAPGSSIYSTIIDSNPAGLGTYGYNTGTSMATPHVAGLTALLLSYAPSLTNSQVQNIIQNSADDLIPPPVSTFDSCSQTYPGYVGGTGWDPCFGYGRINVRRALEQVALQTAPAQPLLFIDDNMPLVSSNILVITNSSEMISWSAVISPTVPWLSLSPPASGAVSASTTDQFITVNATNPSPGNYGLYTADLVLTGTTATGPISPITVQVQLYYVPEVKTNYFPFIFKN